MYEYMHTQAIAFKNSCGKNTRIDFNFIAFDRVF